MAEKSSRTHNLTENFSVSNSPSVTASRATSPYTGEAFTRELFVMYYQLNSIIHLSTTKLKLITLPPYTSAILRSCEARLLPSAAK